MTGRIQALVLTLVFLLALCGCKPTVQQSTAQDVEPTPTETTQAAETPEASAKPAATPAQTEETPAVEPEAATETETSAEAPPDEPAPMQPSPIEGLVLDENEVFFPAF